MTKSYFLRYQPKEQEGKEKLSILESFFSQPEQLKIIIPWIDLLLEDNINNFIKHYEIKTGSKIPHRVQQLLENLPSDLDLYNAFKTALIKN